MRSQPVIIAVAVVVMLVLGVVAVRQNTQLVSEKARIAQLQGKVGSLEQEVAGLQDIADYYFFLKRAGLDPKTVIRPSTLKKLAQMTGDDLRGKREAFEREMPVDAGSGKEAASGATQQRQETKDARSQRWLQTARKLNEGRLLSDEWYDDLKFCLDQGFPDVEMPSVSQDHQCRDRLGTVAGVDELSYYFDFVNGGRRRR